MKSRPRAEKQSKQAGVSWNKRSKRWRAWIGTTYLGRFKTEEEAIKARLEAEAKYQ